MKPETKKRLLRTLVFSLVALAVGIGVGYIQVRMENARSVTKSASTRGDAMKIAGLDIGGPYTLTSHEGERVSNTDFDGQYKLIYFGFTYCPAICPTELQKVSRVMRALEKNHSDTAKTIQPIFVTVDPERDTVDVMREYVSLFHPRMVGLTGTVQEIDLVKKNYRIFATKVQDEVQNDYTMDHSSFIYLMGPDDKIISMYRTTDTPDDMYADIEMHLNLSGS